MMPRRTLVARAAAAGTALVVPARVCAAAESTPATPIPGTEYRMTLAAANSELGVRIYNLSLS
jgi:hypothetical protein